MSAKRPKSSRQLLKALAREDRASYMPASDRQKRKADLAVKAVIKALRKLGMMRN